MQMALHGTLVVGRVSTNIEAAHGTTSGERLILGFQV